MKLSKPAYDEQAPRELYWLIPAVAAIGFSVGIGHACWQANVETAQVVAGLIDYPTDNSYYIYHTRLWSLLNQVPAAMLTLGVSEQTVSILFSGLAGMLSYLALALWTMAIGRGALIALLAPCIVHGGLYSLGAINFGVIYPIMLLGTPHTYGMIGPSFGLLCLALLAIGMFRTGALMLGIAPAIHPTLGLWCFAVAALTFAINTRYAKTIPWQALFFFLIGGLITTASLVHQLHIGAAVPDMSVQQKDHYLDTFVSYWDGHRRPMAVHHYRGVSLAVACFILSLGWLIRFGTDLSRGGRWLMAAASVTAGLGLASYGLTAFHDHLPRLVVMAMPGRYVNLAVLLYPAIVLGLMAACSNRPAVRILIVLWLCGLLFSVGRPWLPWLAGWNTLWTVLCLVTPALIVARLLPVRFLPWLANTPAGAAVALLSAVVAALLAFDVFGGVLIAGLIAAGMVVVVLKLPVRATAITGTVVACAAALLITSIAIHWTSASGALRDWRNDRLYAAMHHRAGALLTGSDLFLIQLQSRRPVLLCGGALDTMTYVPQSAPKMVAILQDLYGIDYFNPPTDIRKARPGALLPASGKALWETRSDEQWRRLATAYHFTDVLTYAHWKLDLPVLWSDEQYRLYTVTPALTSARAKP